MDVSLFHIIVALLVQRIEASIEVSIDLNKC